jgi:hypothetical protein
MIPDTRLDRSQTGRSFDRSSPTADNLAMKVLNYRVLLRKEPEGGYTVTVPSLPGCVTHGATLDEALAMAKEAVELGDNRGR